MRGRVPRAPGDDMGMAAVDLYWLPLGAGGRSVRLNGKVFEAVSARVQRRSACDLYHSALEVSVDSERFVIEMAPAWDANGASGGPSSRAPSEPAGQDVVVGFATRCAAGRTGGFPTLRRPSTARSDSAKIRGPLDICWTSFPRCRPGSGVETSSRRARCGTRTPSSSWLLAAQRHRRFPRATPRTGSRAGMGRGRQVTASARR